MTLYFIAIVLPQHLNEKVLPLKTMMLEKFGCKVGLKSPAHITLVPPFWMNENFEAELISDINQIANSASPFTIATNNFSAFKPRTIFIDVVPNNSLYNLKQVTDHFFSQKENYGVKTDKRPFHPHITIATRDMHRKIFSEAWPMFENKIFKEAWVADGLSLLRHNTKNWEVIHTAGFIV